MNYKTQLDLEIKNKQKELDDLWEQFEQVDRNDANSQPTVAAEISRVTTEIQTLQRFKERMLKLENEEGEK